MRVKFDEQLQQLNIELIQMGALCEDAIGNALAELLKNGNASKHGIQELEAEINRKERSIEQLCMRLLLQQQPVASDLRNISAAMKMVSDMERIGDQAADIAEIATFIERRDRGSFVHVEEMANATAKMVSDSIDSFVKKDLTLAHSVIERDDVVDDLLLRVKQEIANLLVDDKQNAELCMDLLMVAKYFERIGDHATNIAEWVVFAMTGEK